MTVAQLDSLITLLTSRPAPETPDVGQSRARYEKLAVVLGGAPDAKCEKVDAGGVPAEWVAAPGVDAERAVLYLHGGGYAIGSINTHRRMAYDISSACSARVLLIDYRLAPEHPFPTPTDDSLAAFRYIRDNAGQFGADPTRLAVGGDSAGGNISAVVCQACQQAGEPMPAFQMLIYPATDARRLTESRRLFAEGYFLTQELMDWFWKAYAPAGADLTDLRLSPLLAKDVRGLPPAFVLTAGYDPLRDEGRAYADRLIDADVKTTYVNYPGTIHGFFSLTRFLQQGLKANDEAAAVLAAHFGT